MATDNTHPRPLLLLSERLLAALLGLGAGLSPFFGAYYDNSVWVPIGIFLVALSAVMVVAGFVARSGPMAMTVAGLLGLGVWSLASSAWAESVQSAVVGADRWLAYGALLLLALALLKDKRHAALLASVTTLAVGAVALSVLIRLLGSHPQTLFLQARLNSPLGYINGEGCLFVVGFWLFYGAVESRRPLMASLAAGMATLMACLAILTQSRGSALAMLVALAVVVAIVPGRTRRIYGLLVLAGSVVLAGHDLLQVYDNTSGGLVSVQASHAAGRAAVLAALLASLVWGLLSLGWERLIARRGEISSVRAIGSRLLLIPLLVALLLAGVSAHRIERSISHQWHAFTHLATPSLGGGASSASQPRLLSGAGNRYDYWRIAWKAWREHPLLGVGSGNYPRIYYEQRATTEDIQQPHSIELQTLSELGLVGGLLLACLLLGIGWATLRMRLVAAVSPSSRVVMVSGVGAFVAWLTQTSVDWMHLLPGLTAIAILAAAVLISSHSPEPPPVAARDPQPSRMRARRPAGILGLGAMLTVLVIAGASLSRQYFADLYRTRAQNEASVHPSKAISDANRSLGIDSDAVETYYVKAAALARFDQAGAVESTLRQALALEPNNFVTWALLGDVAVRERRLTLAKRDYEHAHLLNPRDVTLSALAAHPQ